MPELALSFAIGWFAVFAATAYFCLLLHRRNTSESMKILKQNLTKVSHYWSCSQGEILPGSDKEFQRDQRRSLRSTLLLGVLSSLLSWLGLFIFLLLMFSLLKLAVSRREQAVFSGPLSHNLDLTSDQISLLISELPN